MSMKNDDTSKRCLPVDGVVLSTDPSQAHGSEVIQKMPPMMHPGMPPMMRPGMPPMMHPGMPPRMGGATIVVEGQRNWEYGLCTCCSDCDSYCETYWCFFCQISRQYNMMLGDKTPSIPWIFCCCFTIISSSGVALPIYLTVFRSVVRGRFNIRGSLVSDFCTSLCCTFCVVQQTLLEMSSRGFFPGACCYNERTFSVVMN
ncbi:putative ama1 protein [Trypanosoma vivax]|nr:putative ama1 protein [Trypanosoma vivax]